MDLRSSNDGEARFSAYVEGLTSVIGHADRAKPLRDYCLGLMMPCQGGFCQQYARARARVMGCYPAGGRTRGGTAKAHEVD
jgi:SRSO17 transposase